MYRYVIKRLLLMIPVVLGVSFIIFTIMYFIPGDPASNILGVGASPEAVAQLNEELGYNDPFHFSRSFGEYYHIPPSEYRRRASP